MRSDEPVLGVTRAGVAILLALALANGVFLYLFPSRAEVDYAWVIQPPVSAAFMGAGYLAGVLATALAVSARSFASIRPLVLAFCTLSVMLLAATLIHADRFRWDYPATWLWTAVYACLPVAAYVLSVRQNRVAGPAGQSGHLRGALRFLSLGVGAVLVVMAAALFIAPDAVLDEWPWPITPLLSRVFAGWYALAGVALVYSAVTLGRPCDGVIVYATVTAWATLSLILPIAYQDDMRTEAAGYWIWIVLFVGAALVCSWALAQALADRKASSGRSLDSA